MALALALRVAGDVTPKGLASAASCSRMIRGDLHLLGDPLPPATPGWPRDSDLPALERLVLCLSRDADPAPVADVVAALHRLHAHSLRHVHVSGSDDLVALIEGLCARPLPPSWTLLSLEGVLHDEDDLLAALAAHAGVLGRLERLALPLVDDLSEDAAVRAVELLPRLVDSDELPDQLLPGVSEDW